MTISRRRFLQVGGAVVAATVGCDRLPDSVLELYSRGEPELDPFQPPASGSMDLVAHALNRLSFGARPGDYTRIRHLAPVPDAAFEAYLDEQFRPRDIDDSIAERAVRRFESLNAPAGELFEYKEDFLLGEMTSAALLRAALSERQLYEVMVQFWTDHFNIDSSKGDCRWLKAADDRLVVREHALGKFPDLVRASALSPAMLWYLDGRVNRVAGDSGGGPNENYARELLELHTLGVQGGYTQKDVMEVARALTGWIVRAKKESTFRLGSVEFAAALHDDGTKVVLGHTIPAGQGPRDLFHVLEIVSLHPSTAQHIATKLCRRFIADEPPLAATRAVARAFLESDGDIRVTLRALFGRSEFVASRGNKFKRPFNYVVSALRATGARTDAGAQLTDFLLRMGHAPYQYPTPDGYPEEASPWLGTLLWRWNFAVALTENRIAGTHVDVPGLTRAAGGDVGLMSHMLGRKPTSAELAAYAGSGAGLALILASPAFQMA
ncbi:MAG: DUF1800 domain-containing protein [Anaerolineae bacterium]|nr:DUF1800 domain-containing protein [Gemmatimonadaceae bacterium]